MSEVSFNTFSLEDLLSLSPSPSVPGPDKPVGAEVIRNSLDALTDPRLEASIERALGTGLQMIAIANTPLAHSGAHLKSEDNATRFWLSLDLEASAIQRDVLLKSFFHSLVFTVHKSNVSLFLHPWLFGPDQDHCSSAPPFCVSEVEGDYETVNLAERAGSEVTTETEFSSERLSFHTRSIADYQASDLKKLWEEVSQRAPNGDLGQDARAQLNDQARATHDLVCTWLSRVNQSEAGLKTRLVACPISSMTVDVGRSDFVLSKNVTGMAWLTIVGPTPASVKERTIDDERARSLVRTLWLHLLSENLLRRGQAEFDLGQEDAVDTATHELKHVATALRSWVRASSTLFDTHIVPRLALKIDSNKLGSLQLADDAQLAPEDIATVFLPRMFDQGLAYIVTWTMSDAPVDLPFYSHESSEMPVDFLELATKCWESAFDSLLFAKAWKVRVNPDGIAALKLAHVNLREMFLPVPVTVEGDPGQTFDVWGNWSDERAGARSATWFSRMLIHLFREAIQHGDWHHPIRIIWSQATDWSRVRISNPVGNSESKRMAVSNALASLSVLSSAALRFGDDFLTRPSAAQPHGRAATHGGAVLKFICRRLDATEPEGSEIGQSPFWREVTFRGSSSP